MADLTVDIPRAQEGLDADLWSARWTGTHPTVDGLHRFSVLAAGISRLVVDGAVVAGEREFGQVFDGPALPVSGEAGLRAGRPVSIRLDYSSATAWPPIRNSGSAGTSSWDGSHRTR